jgi:hypothetical protein
MELPACASVPVAKSLHSERTSKPAPDDEVMLVRLDTGQAPASVIVAA